jgi:hypothetical protein
VLLGGINDEELRDSYRAYWQQVDRKIKVLSWRDAHSVAESISWRWDIEGDWFERCARKWT